MSVIFGDISDLSFIDIDREMWENAEPAITQVGMFSLLAFWVGGAGVPSAETAFNPALVHQPNIIGMGIYV